VQGVWHKVFGGARAPKTGAVLDCIIMIIIGRLVLWWLYGCSLLYGAALARRDMTYAT
jgi:hypothetical protein